MINHSAVRPHIVFGYHGCDQEVGEYILRGGEMVASTKKYNWLGDGRYFWEADPARAMLWAIEARKRHEREKRESDAVRLPYVFGAVILLGRCLDLTAIQGVALVKNGHMSLCKKLKAEGTPMPSNAGGKEMKGRFLDRAVINHTCFEYLEKNREDFDTVRAVFLEGSMLYKRAGFRELTHTQLCIRRREAILGVFRIEQPQILGHE